MGDVVLAEVAVKTSLKCETVRDVEFFVKDDTRSSFFRFFILESTAVKPKHIGLFTD